MHKGRLQVLFSLSYNTSGRPKIGQKEKLKKAFAGKVRPSIHVRDIS
jgi:hypothetical protein